MYYQLSRMRQARRIRDIVLVRLEQLCPFPHDLITRARLWFTVEIMCITVHYLLSIILQQVAFFLHACLQVEILCCFSALTLAVICRCFAPACIGGAAALRGGFMQSHWPYCLFPFC